MKFPHDRVTVNQLRIAECGMRNGNQKFRIPHSAFRTGQVGKPASRAFCLVDCSRQNIQGKHGEFLLGTPCFSCLI